MHADRNPSHRTLIHVALDGRQIRAHQNASLATLSSHRHRCPWPRFPPLAVGPSVSLNHSSLHSGWELSHRGTAADPMTAATPLPLSLPPLSLSYLVVTGAWQWEPPGVVRRAPFWRKGLGPFCLLFPPNFFCVSWLLAHSTKTANPISQPPIPTQSLNDHLSTIHSQNTSRFNLINIELHLRSTT